MVVKYKSEISLIGLVNWVLGLEKGTIWIVPFFSFIAFSFPGCKFAILRTGQSQQRFWNDFANLIVLIPLQIFPSRNRGLISRIPPAFEEPNLLWRIPEWCLLQSHEEFPPQP